jgi:hypothetical protein
LTHQTVCVGFGGVQVSVHSDVPEVITRIERDFREMLMHETTSTATRLNVNRECGRYRLEVHDRSFGDFSCLSQLIARLRYELVVLLSTPDPRLLWFHAGAAAHEGRAVMILGPGGRGKSTLVTQLCSKGWAYLSDDIIPVDWGSDRAVPFPLTPAVREDQGTELPLERLPSVRKVPFFLEPGAVCRTGMPISALVFPTYCLTSPAKLLPSSPGNAALELLGSCLNFTGLREAAVNYICDLVERRPSFHLTYSNDRLAAELIAGSHDYW